VTSLRLSWQTGTDRPVIAGLVALTGSLGFVLLRLRLAADGNITKFVRAARPFSHRDRVPRGLFVFPANGYDGQFYYRLALDPANLHYAALGITMDMPFRLQRIGYPALAWLVSLGHHSWVPVALVVVNVLALSVIGLVGGMLARDSGRHALSGLLLAGYFGFFISIGCDLTEPVAAACLLGGVLAYRRSRPALAGLLFAYGALTRETVLIVPLAIGLTRLADAVRRRGRPGAADLAWCLPVIAFGGWQLVLRAATGTFILLAGVGSNSSRGLPLGGIVDAVRMNLGLLLTPTGAAYIWFLEVATLTAFVVVALASLRSAAVPAYERLAFVVFIIELGVLSAHIWNGHADLRSIDEVYLFAVMILLRSEHRRLGVLALGAGLAMVVAATHQALYLLALGRGHGTATGWMTTGPRVGSSSVACERPAGVMTSMALGTVAGSIEQIGFAAPTGQTPNENGCAVIVNARAWSELKPSCPVSTTLKAQPDPGVPNWASGSAIVTVRLA
jgi:hypothetical protein